jgi:hypothetical protein
MVGTNAVRLDIKQEYPLLHPVFNVSLLTKYFPPNSLMERGIVDGIKDNYYNFVIILDWSKLSAVLDVQSKKKGKYEYLVSWTDSTPGEYTWISKSHFPDRI